MRIKQWVVLCVILGSVQGVLFAATYQDISELGTSAGMIGVGNVGGFSRSAAGLLENPVGLSEAGNSVSTFYTNLFGDIDYMTGAVSYQVMPEITLGVGAILEVNANNDITSTNNANEVVSDGSFTAYTAQYIAGADILVAPKLNLGVTWTHYARKQSTLEGTGGDLGLGLRYGMDWGNLLLYSKNLLGQKVVYNNDATEDLMRETGLSAKSVPIEELHGMEIFGQIKHISDLNVVLKGLGLQFYPMNNPYLGVSLGYKDKYQSNSVTRGLLSAGVQLNMGALRFDYAYDTTDVYQQENQHYFSMSIHFPVVHTMARASIPQAEVSAALPKEVPAQAPVVLAASKPAPVTVSAPVSAPIPTPVPSMPLAVTGPVSVSTVEPVTVAPMPERPKPAAIKTKAPQRITPAVSTVPVVKQQSTVASVPVAALPAPVPAPVSTVPPTQVSVSADDMALVPTPTLWQRVGAVMGSVGTGVWNVIRAVLGWFL
jgi:hypothetical protein